MKILFSLLSLSLTVCALATTPKNIECHCKNCSCMEDNHCGCFSEAGCHCLPGAECGKKVEHQ